MLTTKRFLRFVVNGEKIKAINIITKVYDDDEFIRIEEPYIYATGGQENIDMDYDEIENYMPLGHYKCVGGVIVKKSDEEIVQWTQEYEARKKAKTDELLAKETLTNDAKDVIKDKNATIEQKVDAITTLINNKVI